MFNLETWDVDFAREGIDINLSTLRSIYRLRPGEVQLTLIRGGLDAEETEGQDAK